MNNFPSKLCAALLITLFSNTCDAAKSGIKQCVMDVNLSEKVLTGKNVANCEFGEASTTCALDRPCQTYIWGAGMAAGAITLTPQAPQTPTAGEGSGILVSPQIGGSQAQYQCISSACTISWKTNNRLQEAQLSFRQTTMAPLKVQIKFNYMPVF